MTNTNSRYENSLDELIKKEYNRMTAIRDSYETAVFLTDQHIPFQDEDVHKIAQEYVAEQQPKYIIFGGDLIDNPAMSVFDQDPNHQRTAQEEIDEAVRYLSAYRRAAPEAKMVLLPGNHDVLRLERTKSINQGVKSLRATGWKNLLEESARHQEIDLGDIEIIDDVYWGEYTIGGDKGMLFCHGDPRMDSRVYGGKTGFRRTAEEHPFEGHIMMGHQHQAKKARSRHRPRDVYIVPGMLDAEGVKYNHQSTYEVGFAVVHYNPQVRPRPVFHVQNLTMAPNGSMIIDGKEYNARRTHR